MHAHEAINAIVSTKVNSQAFPDLPEGKESMNDAVNHPKHYTSHPSGIETIEITGKLPFALGNAVKYLMRSQYKKNRIEDLKKARWYLEYHAKHWSKVFETFDLYLILEQFRRTVMSHSYQRSPEDSILVRLFYIWAHGRTLTSAWIETLRKLQTCLTRPVALSRVRGLKHRGCSVYIVVHRSHSHECVD